MNVRRNSFLFYTALLALAVGVCVLPTAAWALSAGTTIDMSDPNPPPSGTGWTYAGDVYTIQSGADVMVTGDNQLPNPSQRRISVTAGPMATITLDGVSITGPDDFQSPLLLNSGANVTLKWTEGTTNTLTASFFCAGIQTTGAALEIVGPDSGSLTAKGGTNGGAGTHDPDQHSQRPPQFPPHPVLSPHL